MFQLLERVPYRHWRVTPDFKELQLLLVPEPTTRRGREARRARIRLVADDKTSRVFPPRHLEDLKAAK